ncbi:MAG: prolipoprotein diacylglyceryl transferase [Lachnospiraceae bacterium]|nr:prolipoprotein diacylglyceryl transferase [Lachnospiraceae bacterium]
MRTIFFLKNNTILYWDNVVMVLAMVLFAFLFYTLYVSGGGKRRVLLLYIPLAVGLSFLCSRLLYWFCHQEQFAGIAGAFAQALTPGYCMTGVLVGTLLAALLTRLTTLEKKTLRILDAVGPSLAFTFGVLRLSALFNETCRGKIEVLTENNRHLPLAATITNALGETEYRLATFMLEAILFFLLFVVLLFLFIRLHYSKKYSKKKFPRTGAVYYLAVVMIGSVEMILDSTRYDSCFMPFNGFVSLVQILSAVSALAAFVLIVIRCVRKNGWSVPAILCSVFFLACIAGVGITEYLIQRHGDWYRSCYLGMGIACLGMDVLAVLMTFFTKKIHK